MKLPHRKLIRRAWRTTLRRVNRSCVCVRWRAPDDLGNALKAFGRALRARRRLAKLAPRFFDTAVIDREAENRAEQRRWMAAWAPALARAYGTEPVIPADDHVVPPLPPPRIQRAVERQLADWKLWMEMGRTARERHQQRHPHALPSWCRMARLLEQALDFKKLALGLDSPNPLPDKITYDDDWPDLKRAYGHQADRPPSIEPALGNEAAPQNLAASPASLPSNFR